MKAGSSENIVKLGVEQNRKVSAVTGINDFKRGYQPRNNLVKGVVICLQIPTTF
jgi:hypothetical protein